MEKDEGSFEISKVSDFKRFIRVKKFESEELSMGQLFTIIFKIRHA